MAYLTKLNIPYLWERKVTAMTEARKERRRRGEQTTDDERRQLMEGMAQTREELSRAYAQFNSHSDPDLVDSCVFTINALRSRYSYFIRQMKLLDEGKAEAG